MKNLKKPGFVVPEEIQKLRDAWFESDTKRDSSLSVPDNIRSLKDIPYGGYGNYNLLDVYRTKTTLNRKIPVIINIHGGGFFYGSKEIYQYYCMNLALNEFAVINFNYRLAPEYAFPASLEDINRVMCWVEANAEEYALDTDNVFLIGDSAGAQLVSHYAAIYSNSVFDALYSFSVPKNIKIRAVSMACGLYDFHQRLDSEDNSLMLRNYLGNELFESLSEVFDERLDVLKYVNGDFPATYIFSSKDDSMREFCLPMYELLLERGCEAEADIYGLDCDFPSYHIFHVDLNHPLSKVANRKQIEFFRKHISN